MSENKYATGGIIDKDGQWHPVITHEYYPDRELVVIPAGSSIFPSNIEVLWEIARQVAERDSVFFDEDASYDNFLCPFCNGGQTFHDHVRKEPFPHSPTCIVTKARELGLGWLDTDTRGY